MHQNTQATGRDPYVKDTASLIASDKVDGTAVYGADGERIGSIKRIILEKRGGRVAYAVLSFGGFLGHWRRTITRCPGKSLPMTRASTAIASISPGSRSKVHRGSPMTTVIGIAIMAATSMISTACRLTGSDRFYSEYEYKRAPLRWGFRLSGVPVRLIVSLYRPSRIGEGMLLDFILRCGKYFPEINNSN